MKDLISATQKYTKCMQENCGEDEDTMRHIDIVKKMAIEKKPPSPNEIKKLQEIAKSLKTDKDRRDKMRCALDKCGKEWNTAKNAQNKAIAGQIENVLRLISTKMKELKSKKK